jgi:hypothetical protein
VAANPANFLTLDWVHPGQLPAFLAHRDVSSSTRPSAVFVKLEASDASVSIRPGKPRVKTEDSGALTIDLTSPARRSLSSSLRTRELLEGDNETIEILSSDDEMEVEASLRPSAASSDPPELAAPDPEPASFGPSDPIASNDNSDEFPSEPAPSGPSHPSPDSIATGVISRARAGASSPSDRGCER